MTTRKVMVIRRRPQRGWKFICTHTERGILAHASGSHVFMSREHVTWREAYDAALIHLSNFHEIGTGR